MTVVDTGGVLPVLATSLITATLVTALWSLVLLLLSRPIGKRYLLGALGLIEVALLVQAVLGIVRLPGHHIEAATFVGYLLASLVILPLAGWWSLQERTRWGVGVLLVGSLAVTVMIVRMNQLWSGSA
ncbi:hypothetical protein [Labedaea rhizosphaerae]|uniref:Uncharacterized protein n=1 Tax=Labedaea rhizosphaerae TaxID=598644 RepID=A0A4R6SE90_LABRH|nr:hypothetical protein [Labedaea rhizosphaerae]TDP98024.1 hypothetical protein EV186_1031004 [Labedaea rhizosphaerae]